MDNITYTVRKRTHEGRMGYELFSLKDSDKTIASCWIVYPTQAPKGWITPYESFSDKDGKFVMLYYVKATVKGKGIGQILFKKLIEYLKSKNIKRIYLDVDQENTRAQKFYLNYGFKQKWKSFSDYQYYLNI